MNMQNIPSLGLEKVAKILSNPSKLVNSLYKSARHSEEFFNPEEYISQKVRE
jgi:hypothetical protein